MNKERLSVSVDPELATWVKNSDKTNSEIVQEAVEKLYKEEKYGREKMLKKKKRELESKLDRQKSKINEIREEIEDIDDQLKNTVSIEEEKADQIIEYAVSLIPKEPKYRAIESVAGLTQEETKEVLNSIDLHYAEWIPEIEQGRKDEIPEELKEQDKKQYETGKYGQIQNREDFQDAYHQLSSDQEEQIRNQVDDLF